MSRRSVLVALLVATLAVTGCQGSPNAGTPQVTASAGPRPSELYASDGKTLIATFDTDPHAACLRVPVNDWGFYCDYLVTWWESQPVFGADAGQRSDRLRTGGYRIVGSLDAALQKTAKAHLEQQRTSAKPDRWTVASLQPGTGRLRAMVVNRDYAPGSPTPSAAQGMAQPPPVNEFPGTTQPLFDPGVWNSGQGGATFMIFTLVAALEKGIPLDHAVDTKQRYASKFIIDPHSSAACDGSHWCPTNSGDPAYLSGRRTMWDAFGHAVNTYFVPLEEQVGAQSAVDAARRMGITFGSELDAAMAQNGNADQWGAFTLGVSGVTPIELADAYATLAADGTHCDPIPVERIEGTDGKPVPAGEPRCSKVLSPDVARAALDAARCAVGDRSAFGDVCGSAAPAAAARGLVGRPVAGQLGIGSVDGSAALVLAGPQLATAGMTNANPDCAADCHRSPAGPVAAPLLQTVSAIQHDGLAALPIADLPAPSQQLAHGG